MVDAPLSAARLRLRPDSGTLGTGRRVVWSRSGEPGRGTLWLTLLYLPVWPLRSVRAHPAADASGETTVEVVGGAAQSPADALRTVALSLAGWAVAWSPLAFALYWLKRGSLLAPLLGSPAAPGWLQPLAGPVDSFEGALRLLIGAWWLMLCAALAERRRPRVAADGADTPEPARGEETPRR